MGTSGDAGASSAVAGTRAGRALQRLVAVEPQELRAVLVSFVYFFSLLCGYYMLRPIREEMGIAGGVENLPWLFTGTFLGMLAMVPLFGWLSSRYPRRTLLPFVYAFFIVNLLIFWLLFNADVRTAPVARAFYIWLSVFNLFVVSVFWSFMTDIFREPQARRLFGFIAGGGTVGAITGPMLTASLVGTLGTVDLLPVSAGFLVLAVLCVLDLNGWSRAQSLSAGQGSAAREATERGLGGGVWAGIQLVLASPYLLGICVLILLYASLSTFIYLEQAEIVRDAFTDPAERTRVFALMDLAVNVLTIVCQLLFTARIVKALGIAWTLAAVPLALVAGFLALAWAPVLGVLVVVQVLRRAGDYALMRPSREMLYVVLDRAEKYKAKNFIDTTVYRGGDAVSAWVYDGLRALSLSLAHIALIGALASALWAWVALRMGRAQRQLAAARAS
jgi:AAA family ATP:ADP antiporter